MTTFVEPAQMSRLSDIHTYKPMGVITAAHMKVYETIIPPEFKQSDAVLIDEKTIIGIEVEVENVGREPLPEFGGAFTGFWRTEADNSLRNNGIEFISVPIKGDQIRRAVGMIAGLPKSVQFSPRTSVHIHMNIRDLTPEEIAKIVMVYMCLEKLLFRFAGEFREQNNFSVPLYNLRWIDKLVTELMAFNKGNLKALQSQEMRYSALNFEPMFGQGSIEFRHLGGTNNPQRMFTWINILFAIKQYAVLHDYETLRHNLVELNSNSHYRQFATDVLGRFFNEIETPTPDKDIEKGVTAMKRALMAGGFKAAISGRWEGSAACRVMIKKHPIEIPIPFAVEFRNALQDDVAAQGIGNQIRFNVQHAQGQRAQVAAIPVDPAQALDVIDWVALERIDAEMNLRGNGPVHRRNMRNLAVDRMRAGNFREGDFI